MYTPPKDDKLITKEAPGVNQGVNPFDNKGIQPRSNGAPIGTGSNSTAPYEGKGYSSNSPKTGYNEKQ